MKEIRIKKETKIPGTDYVLEVGDRIKVLESNLEQQANQAMVDAAEDAGIDDPDPELLWWDGRTLVYNGMSIYPDSRYLNAAWEAWREYQDS